MDGFKIIISTSVTSLKTFNNFGHEKIIEKDLYLK